MTPPDNAPRRRCAPPWPPPAAEELEDDNLTILDLENIVLTGEIVAQQRDRATREVKSVILGHTLEGRAAEAVVKTGPRGSLFFITVFVIDG